MLLLHRRLFRRRFRPDPLALHVLRHGIGGGLIFHAPPLCLFCRHAHSRRLGLSVLLRHAVSSRAFWAAVAAAARDSAETRASTRSSDQQ